MVSIVKDPARLVALADEAFETMCGISADYEEQQLRKRQDGGESKGDESA